MSIYKCIRCGRVIDIEETGMRCPECSSRIFIKEKPARIKKVKAI